MTEVSYGYRCELFQSLIGRLQTLDCDWATARKYMFQSLIGRLQTIRGMGREYGHVEVSIPHR